MIPKIERKNIIYCSMSKLKSAGDIKVNNDLKKFSTVLLFPRNIALLSN
jgi:hypothetical protein